VVQEVMVRQTMPWAVLVKFMVVVAQAVKEPE
jgi:hypothetical protein